MSYTPPAGDAADFSWVGVAAYTPPAGYEADCAWTPEFVTGVGAATLTFVGAAVGFHGGITSGAAAATLSFTGVAAGAHGVAGPAAGALAFTAGALGGHGVAGAATGAVGFGAAAVAIHPRYELRGVTMVGDVLVNRRVYAYLRATGALVGQADTVAGRFAVHAGFTEAEHFVTPIDTDPAATDWAPPTANRVLSVLADDAA